MSDSESSIARMTYADAVSKGRNISDKAHRNPDPKKRRITVENSAIMLAFAKTRPSKPVQQEQQIEVPTAQLIEIPVTSIVESDNSSNDTGGPKQPAAPAAPKAKGKRAMQQTSTIQTRKIITKWMNNWVKQNGGNDKG